MRHLDERDYLGKAMEIAVRLAVVGFIVFGAARIVSPFVVTVVWAIVLAITAYPFYLRLTRAFGGRARLACAVYVVASLALVVVPTVLLGNSLLDATVRVVEQARTGTLEIPPPTEKVRDWPLVGERVYAVWHGAATDLAGTLAKLQPQARNLGNKIVRGVGDLGKALLQTVFAVIIAGILMMRQEGGSRAARAIARRLAGDTGPPMVDTTIGTIRSVVKGVVLVSLIQGLLAAVGLVVAGVPGVGLWTLLVMMLAVMQLPPLLLLGPIAVWVFAHASPGIAVFFAIWSVLVSISDSLLKPLLLGRGVPLPMLVILIGAIGGMLRAGLVGLFIGPVILATFYQLFLLWVEQAGVEEASLPAAAESRAGPEGG